MIIRIGIETESHAMSSFDKNAREEKWKTFEMLLSQRSHLLSREVFYEFECNTQSSIDRSKQKILCLYFDTSFNLRSHIPCEKKLAKKKENVHEYFQLNVMTTNKDLTLHSMFINFRLCDFFYFYFCKVSMIFLVIFIFRQIKHFSFFLSYFYLHVCGAQRTVSFLYSFNHLRSKRNPRLCYKNGQRISIDYTYSISILHDTNALFIIKQSLNHYVKLEK